MMSFHNCPFASHLQVLQYEMASGERIEDAHEELQASLQNLEWMIACEDCAQKQAHWAKLFEHVSAQVQAILDYWEAETMG